MNRPRRARHRLAGGRWRVHNDQSFLRQRLRIFNHFHNRASAAFAIAPSDFSSGLLSTFDIVRSWVSPAHISTVSRSFVLKPSHHILDALAVLD